MDADAFNFALLVFRVAIGAVLAAHGYGHIFRGGKIAGTAGWFDSLGMKPGKLHAWLASGAELAAGVSLILGLFVPLGAAAVIATMTVALITAHRSNGFFIFNQGQGWEYVMTLIVSGVLLSTLGGGEWSLDYVLDIFDPPGSTGLVIGLLAGFGGAFGLLAACWRPPATD